MFQEEPLLLSTGFRNKYPALKGKILEHRHRIFDEFMKQLDGLYSIFLWIFSPRMCVTIAKLPEFIGRLSCFAQ